MTRIAGVTGHPIGHSLSPVIHGAWIAALGLDARYQAFDAPNPEAFRLLAHRVRTGELAGLNVTSPYKLDALAAANEVGTAAKACGSVNLLVPAGDGKLRGDSTDATGLLAALDAQASELALSDLKVVLLGAGGAARSAAQGVRHRGARLWIVNRTQARAEALAETFGAQVGGLSDLAQADLLINALSHPPDPAVVDALPATAVVMDMSYRPMMTPLLQAAAQRGLRTVDGLAMLIGQARPSFEAMFKVTAPDIDVRAIALKALEVAR